MFAISIKCKNRKLNWLEHNDQNKLNIVLNNNISDNEFQFDC